MSFKSVKVYHLSLDNQAGVKLNEIQEEEVFC